MTIRLLSSEEKPPYDLLLLADPSVTMLEKYLFEGSVYVATIDGQIVGVFVLFPLIKRLLK